MKIKRARICFLFIFYLLRKGCFRGLRCRLFERTSGRSYFPLGGNKGDVCLFCEMSFWKVFLLPYLYCIGEGTLCQTKLGFIHRIDRPVLLSRYTGGS